jgi:cytochrome c553
MNLIRSTIAILALVSASVSSPAGDVDSVSWGESFAKTNCAWCHGASGQGFATAPQLAGQRPAYIENQLRSFYDHSRDNPLSQQYMWGAAAKLDSEVSHNLAAYFSTLDAEAAKDGDEELVGIGKTIYQVGMPESNIAACVACHGPNAEGIGQIPRLAGLSYHYLKRKLKQWGEGYHSSAARPMPKIASKLSTPEIEALASYLSFVR